MNIKNNYTDFKDHFSDGSIKYSAYRPKYPDELFSYLSTISQNNKMAWDSATGSGQSALGLLHYFDNIIATDASKNQIDNAKKQKGINYKVEKSECTSIDSNSIDLITVAQALHWFNLEEFTLEVKRVLKTKGILAIWTYSLLNINTEIDDLIKELYGSTLDSYWPPERKIVEEGYKNITFPFTEIKSPPYQMELEWDLSQLVGYLCTWSAVRKFEVEEGINPVEQLYDKIADLWGDPEQKRVTRWPLTLKTWIKNT